MNKSEKEKIAVLNTHMEYVRKHIDEIKKHLEKQNESSKKMLLAIQSNQFNIENHLNNHKRYNIRWGVMIGGICTLIAALISMMV